MSACDNFIKKVKSYSVKEFWTTLYNNVIDLSNEQPNFIYNDSIHRKESVGCYYVSGADGRQDCDGCIIGQALQKMGFSKEDLIPLDNIGSIQEVDMYFNLSDEETNPIVQALREIQKRQDKGQTWKSAVYGIFPENFAN